MNGTELQAPANRIAALSPELFGLAPADVKALFAEVLAEVMEKVRARKEKADVAPKQRIGRKLPVFLRWEKAMELIAVARGEIASSRWQAKRQAAEIDLIILHLGLYLGFRVAEMCNILVKHFDFEARQAFVKEGKGKVDRFVPIAAAAFPVLAEWAQRRPPDDLFLRGPRGDPLYGRMVHWRMNRLGAKVGLPRLHPHVLRHSAATRLVELGMHIRKIQKFLGHADIKVTARYLDCTTSDLREEVDRM